MARLSEAINPISVTSAIANGRLQQAESNPTIPGGHAIAPPPGPGDGRNSFYICSHPLVATVDSLRQFYRQSVPQFRTNLYN